MPDATTQTVGIVLGIAQLIGFVFEIPSGYLADTMGHRNALIIGKSFFVLSTLMYVVASGTVFFIFGAIFFALAGAMLSGTSSVFIKETLILLGRESEFTSILGKIKSNGFIASILAIVAVAFMSEVNYRYAFTIVFVLDCIGLLMTIMLRPVSQKETRVLNSTLFNLKDNIFIRYMKLGWLRYVFVLESIIAIAFAVIAAFRDPLQQKVGFSLSMIGIFFALSRVGIFLALRCNGVLKPYMNFKRLIILQGTTFTVSLLGAGYFENQWVVAVCLMVGAIGMWGFDALKYNLYLDHIGHSCYKASFLSINNFVQKIFSSLFSFLVGMIIIHDNYELSFLIYGYVTVVIVMIAMFILKNQIIVKEKIVA